jgi:hypothetical protein
MFGIEDRISKRNYAWAQSDRVQSQLDHVDSQLFRLKQRKDVDPDRVLKQPYVDEYVVGILDAITKLYESETRQRIGLSLHEKPFVSYASKRLSRSRDEARNRFSTVARETQSGTRPQGFLDGYADGVDALYGGSAPRRLIDHFVAAAKLTAQSEALAS